MIFRVHPQVRAAEPATYCVGGPAHSPHVAAVRVAPGETVELELSPRRRGVPPAGPQLPHALNFRVRPGAAAALGRAARGGPPRGVAALQTRRQKLTLTNGHSVEVAARVERTAGRTDALTAARASTMALFRELFPDQAPPPDGWRGCRP